MSIREEEVTAGEHPGAAPKALISWVHDEVAASPDGQLRALLLLEQADALKSVGEVREAIKEMVNAVNADANLLPAVWMLIGLLTEFKSWKNLIKLHSADQKAAQTASEKACAHFAWGVFQEDHAGDHSGAIDAYSRALAAVPADHAALFALERAAVIAGDVGLLAETLRKQISLARDDRWRALLLTDLARVQHGVEGGSDEEALALLRQAATVEVGQWDWLLALERYGERSTRPEVQAEALEARARLMIALSGMETAGDAVRAHAPWVRSPHDASLWAATLLRRASWLRRPLSPEIALEDLKRAADLCPDDPLVAFELLTLLDEQARIEDAVSLVSRMAASSSDPVSASLWHLRLAEVLARHGQSDGAVEHFRACLELRPGSLIAHAGAEALLLANGRWPELAALYEQTAGAFESRDGELAAMLLLRAAEVTGRVLEEPERALSLLAKAAASTSRADHIDRARAVILARLGRWDEVVEALSRLAAAAPDTVSATVVLEEIAAIRRGHLDDPAGAIEAYQRILEVDPRAGWALECTMELHAQLGQWRELADVLQRKAALESSDERAAACLAVAGWLLQCRAGAPDEAAACYSRAVTRNPGSALATAGLEEIALQRGESRGLRELLLQRARAAAPAAEVERLLLTVALDCEGAGEIEEAASVYTELLEKVGDSRAARWGIARCAKRLGDWRAFAEVMEREVELLGADDDKAAVLLELAEVYLDRLGQTEPGHRALRRAVRAAPELVPAIVMLADQARLDSAWGELDGLLQSILDFAPEAALLVAEERLGLLSGPTRQAPAARVICDVLLENIPDHALARLRKTVLDGLDGDGATRADAWRRLGQLDPTGPFGAALSMHARTIEQARGLPVQGGPVFHGESLAAGLVYSASERDDAPPARKEEVLEARRTAATSDAARAFWTLELAQVAEDRLKTERAEELYLELLARAPENVGALEGLARVSKPLERWDRHVGYLEQLAAIYKEPHTASEQWAAAAAIWTERLGDVGRADHACRKALELDPGNAAAFVRLLAVLRARGDTPGVMELIDQRVGQVDDPAELVQLLIAQAALKREMGFCEASVSSLETALLVDQDNRTALQARAAFDVQDERWGVVVNSLTEWAVKAEPAERRHCLWQAAEVLLDVHGMAQEALMPLRLLVESGDADPETYRRLLLVARRCGAWSEAADAAARLATLTPDQHEAIDARRVEGVIRRDLIGDREGSIGAWRQVAAACPDDLQAIEALGELSSGEDRVAVVAALRLGVSEALALDPTEARALRALLAVHKLSDQPDGALCVLRVLDALGDLTEEESEQLGILSALVPSEPQRPLGPSMLGLLRHPAQAGVAEELHRLIAPILPKLFAADVSALNLGRPIKAQGGDLLVERVSGAAEVFGIQSLALRRSSDPSVSIAPITATEHTIAVGPQQTGHLTPVDRFVLGRALWHTLAQTAAMASRTDSQIRALHDAAIKVGLPTYQPTERRLGVDALVREIQRQIPRRAKRPLMEIAAQMARTDERALLLWCKAVRASADRAGLLLGSDLTAAFTAIVPGWRGDHRDHRAASIERVRASELARELLNFAVSSDYLSLRREVGLAAQSW